MTVLVDNGSMSAQQRVIKDLHGDFHIPAYQRGYRWKEEEVLALLNDIDEFDAHEGRAYCLQPLVVKPSDNTTEHSVWRIIDGQQRLTTTYLILQVLADELVLEQRPQWAITYETRQGSAAFLKNGVFGEEAQQESEKNIDFFHMFTAVHVIRQWAKRRTQKELEQFHEKLLCHTFFIWYELDPEENEVEAFTRINEGKIPLTSSELIKGLLMDEALFLDPATRERRQVEISLSWDRIEQELNRNDYWYFLTNADTREPRIDLLFDVVSQELNPRGDRSAYSSFFAFRDALNAAANREEKERVAEQCWGKVEHYFALTLCLFDDAETYHLLGFIVTCKLAPLEEVLLALAKKKRSEWVGYLKEIVTEKLRDKIVEAASERKRSQKARKSWLTGDELRSLEFGNSKTKKYIVAVLLLFNLVTLIAQKQHDARFPFITYKNENWDIEHVNARNNDNVEASDSLENLVLLDASTNREYKDADFNKKRAIVLQRIQEGRFVPACTVSVFLKSLSVTPDVTHQDYVVWSTDDMDAYIQRIEESFTHYFRKESE